MSGKANATASYPPGYMEEYNGDGLYAIAILFICLVTLSIVLRFYAHRVGNVKWGLDDTLIIPASVSCLALCASDLSYGGLGYHEIAILTSEPAKLVVWAKFVLAGPMVDLAAVLFSKLAILAIYLRIFTFRSFRIACWALAAVLVANWFAFTVTAFMMCTPLNYLWNQRVVGGHCFNIDAFYRWSALPNIVTDLVMLILPLPVVWRLHTSRSIKIGLTITFATGSMGLVTSILRFANFFFYNPTSDRTRTGVYIYIYAIFECCTYNIAACLLTFRPLAMMFRKDGPLSLSRLKSRVATRDGSHISSRTSSIPLGNMGNTKFELLDRDKPSVTRSDARDDAV